MTYDETVTHYYSKTVQCEFLDENEEFLKTFLTSPPLNVSDESLELLQQIPAV